MVRRTLSYLEANRTFVCDFLTEQLPEVTFQKPEGTYLIWLDFSAYGLTDNQLQRKLIKEANVVLNQGNIFGPHGSHHMRLNFACPKELLEKHSIKSPLRLKTNRSVNSFYEKRTLKLPFQRSPEDGR